MLSQNEVKNLRKIYLKGMKLRLLKMDDALAPAIGSIGTISHVDDAGQIHMSWETGSSLALIPGLDSFEFVSE